MLTSSLRPVAAPLASLLVLAAAMTAGAQTVTLHSVMIAPDGTVTVTYSKDFATCAHLKVTSGALVHAQNIFCGSGVNVVVTAPSSSFNSNLAPGVQVRLCHGNNGGICSAFVTVTTDTFTGSPATISVGAGGSQVLVLAAGTSRGLRTYIVAGSISGTQPGIPIGPFVVPLNQDAYFDYTLAFTPTSAPQERPPWPSGG